MLMVKSNYNGILPKDIAKNILKFENSSKNLQQNESVHSIYRFLVTQKELDCNHSLFEESVLMESGITRSSVMLESPSIGTYHVCKAEITSILMGLIKDKNISLWKFTPFHLFNGFFLHSNSKV